MGLFAAILEALGGEDNRIAGQAVTKLTAPLAEDEESTMEVETTRGFGEFVDGNNDARLLVNGEIIDASDRTATTFTGLTRDVTVTKQNKLLPVGTLVLDASKNKSALDLVRRGLFVGTAVGSDLDVIGANLGLHRCSGITDDQWREIIMAIAYLPKQTLDAYYEALTALLGEDNYEIRENIVESPYQVFVDVFVELATSLRGRFYLNGGEHQETTGTNTVDTDYDINHVIGVFDDTGLTRRGFREGFTNYFSGGSFSGNTITLGSSPGGAGTPVIVDYGAFEGHYLAEDETVRDDGDRYPYFSDPLLSTRCLLDQIRAAGVRVNLKAKV